MNGTTKWIKRFFMKNYDDFYLPIEVYMAFKKKHPDDKTKPNSIRSLIHRLKLSGFLRVTHDGRYHYSRQDSDLRMFDDHVVQACYHAIGIHILLNLDKRNTFEGWGVKRNIFCIQENRQMRHNSWEGRPVTFKKNCNGDKYGKGVKYDSWYLRASENPLTVIDMIRFTSFLEGFYQPLDIYELGARYIHNEMNIDIFRHRIDGATCLLLQAKNQWVQMYNKKLKNEWYLRAEIRNNIPLDLKVANDAMVDLAGKVIYHGNGSGKS